jgi:hypothetical protein
MLVILVVVKVTTVLFDTRVDAESAGVNLLGTKGIGIQLAIDFTLLGAISTLNPDALNICATDVVVPMGVRATSVLLRQGEHRSTLHGFREFGGYLLPELAGLARERLELFRELGEGIRALFGYILRDVLHILFVTS